MDRHAPEVADVEGPRRGVMTNSAMTTPHEVAEFATRPVLTPVGVHAGQDVRRRPGGRGCKVVQVSDDRNRVQIRDGRVVFWVKMETVVRKWY